LWKKIPEPSVRAVLDTGFSLPPPVPGRERPHGAFSDEYHAGFRRRIPWTVIRIRDRKPYLSALDRASIEMDIHPFSQNFIVRACNWHLSGTT